MKITRTKFATTVGAVAIATLMLSGCAGGQSKADACKQMDSKVSSVSNDLQKNQSDLASNPKKAAASIDKLAKKFNSASKEVSQPDVKKAAGKAATSLNDFSDQFASYAADPSAADTSKISDSSTKMSDAFSNLQKVCSGK